MNSATWVCWKGELGMLSSSKFVILSFESLSILGQVFCLFCSVFVILAFPRLYISNTIWYHCFPHCSYDWGILVFPLRLYHTPAAGRKADGLSNTLLSQGYLTEFSCQMYSSQGAASLNSLFTLHLELYLLKFTRSEKLHNDVPGVSTLFPPQKPYGTVMFDH